MHIMTKDGWKQLSPSKYEPSGRTPSLLERMGITTEYDGIAAMADYANGEGKGVYFTYNRDGTFYQSLPAVNPLHGMK